MASDDEKVVVEFGFDEGDKHLAEVVRDADLPTLRRTMLVSNLMLAAFEKTIEANGVDTDSACVAVLFSAVRVWRTMPIEQLVEAVRAIRETGDKYDELYEKKTN
jgi:hypothetical protein